jgi:thioredoxin reductase
MDQPGARPHPPGDYPVVVVGSGPGGIQASHSLSALGIGHAVISADAAPGGMFRQFPFFQRLLSWTKPHAPFPHHSREYEWYDLNSLVSHDPSLRAVMPPLMDGSSDFPSRQEMADGIVSFAQRAQVRVRHDCRWESTRRDGDRFVLLTSDGEYRCRAAIFAVGVARPWKPATPGFETVPHYVDTRAAQTYAGKRLFIAGKQNSGFELATGLLAWASRIVLASPRPTSLSVNLHSLSGIRARYLQPREDANLGNGVFILDASIERIERAGSTFLVHTRGSLTGEPLAVEADEVIAATGFQCPVGDLPSLGVSVFGQNRLPAMTPSFESADVPGIYFAGTIGQGVPGLQKFGIGSNSGAVHGARYNARLMVKDLARRHLGLEIPHPIIPPAELVTYLLDELSTAPELWNQQGYLARAVIREGDGSTRDEGIVALADWVDRSGPDGVAVAVETDDQGVIRPVAYRRSGGRVRGDTPLPPHPLHDFRTADHQRLMTEVVASASLSALGRA